MKCHAKIAVCIGLGAATLAVFSPVLSHGFINLDDDVYVVNNRHVQAGLSLNGVRWAFTAVYAATWQPLVWLSYMLDRQLFGPGAFGFHLTNILLHTATTIILFLALTKMTRSPWRSAFVASVFGLHPLRIESVAWIAERKDVLSAFFWVLTMLAYTWYTDWPSPIRYVAVIVAFVVGLMAKPMLVTLPFALLLLDYWPLKRLATRYGTSPKEGSGEIHPARRTLGGLVFEKTPMFVVALGAAVVAYYAQKVGGAVSSLERIPLGVRIADAFAFYTAYLGKMLWPVKLAVLYPHPGASVPKWQVISSGLLLVCITLLTAWLRRFSYLLSGWLWFLGTLLPVIGLVQIGPHGIADRFTYIPMVGILLMVGWGVPRLIARNDGDGQCLGQDGANPKSRSACPLVFPIAALILIVAFAICSSWQVRYWKDNLSLFSRALACTRNNVGILNNMGLALAEQGDFERAIQFYRKALALAPNDAVLRNNMGITLMYMGRLDEAIRHYRRALEIKPSYPEARSNLGFALLRSGRVDEAETQIKRAIKENPNYAPAYQNLGHLYAAEGRINEAISQFQEAVKRNPDFAEAHYNLAVLFGRTGAPDKAIKHLMEVVRINPRDAEAHFRLGILYFGRKDFPNAVKEYQEAIHLAPNMIEARNNLAVALYFAGRYAEAWEQVREIQSRGSNVNPEFLEALSSKMQEAGK